MLFIRRIGGIGYLSRPWPARWLPHHKDIDLYKRLLPISADAGRCDDKNADRLWYCSQAKRRIYRGWVDNAKIGFVGVRMSFGYAMHGFSLNVNDDSSPFNYITPCGIQGVRITSVQELLNTIVNIEEICDVLARHYSDVFQIQMVPIERNNVSKNRI